MGVDLVRQRHRYSRGALDRISLTMYKTLRTIHLLLASFSLPFLVMYSVSAVQMTHSTWFNMKPSVREQQLGLAPAVTDARAVAREVMERDATVRGELTAIQSTAAAHSLRIVLPGTVHEVKYDRATGATTIKTSVAGVMGMLNRLHHAAGYWHEPASLKAWALFVLVVSFALLLMGITGLTMWFIRRTERVTGAVLLLINAVFVVTVLVLMRVQGP
jgi:hypothetical protein